MTNPYESPNFHREAKRRDQFDAPAAQVGWLLLLCIITGVLSTIIGLFVALALHVGVPQELGSRRWRQTDELLMSLPWMWLLHNLLPTGWLFWTGCGLTARTGQRHFLWLIAICGFAVGMWTPMMFYIDG